MSENKMSRRTILKGAGALLAAIPVMAISTNAFAAKNDNMRKALKYQDTPKGKDQCDGCTSWKAPNGCLMMPGDTEIKPAGWCSGYAKKK